MKTLVCALACLTLLSGVLHLSFVNAKEPNRNVRFYKVNKHEQWTKLFFTEKKGRQAGCHNLIVKKRIHRFNQFGYGFCSLHTAKNCTAESVVKASRVPVRSDKEEELEERIQLKQGFSWYPLGDHERGVKLASWYCEI
jgi:hypothetical protein